MLKTVVFEQLKQAMRDKDTLTKGVLTLLKSQLDLAEKEQGSPLTALQETEIVNREIKQTHQALEGAEKAERADLIEQEQTKLKLLESFLPEQLSEEEVKQLLTDNGVVSGIAMGDAMKIAKPLLAGKTDGKTMSTVVKSLIS